MLRAAEKGPWQSDGGWDDSGGDIRISSFNRAMKIGRVGVSPRSLATRRHQRQAHNKKIFPRNESAQELDNARAGDKSRAGGGDLTQALARVRCIP